MQWSVKKGTFKNIRAKIQIIKQTSLFQNHNAFKN